MKQSLQVIEGHRFGPRDFVAGETALDFVNTVAGRDAESPCDRLDGYARLLAWAEAAGLLPPSVLRALARRAEAEPAAAARAFGRAKTLREALFQVVTAIAGRRAPPREALALLRTHWLDGAAAQALRFTNGRVARELDAGEEDLDLIAAMVAWRFVEDVLPCPPERLRICAGRDCAWVFLDTSKAGRRRWCDMAVCGNTAKARRHAARARARR